MKTQYAPISLHVVCDANTEQSVRGRGMDEKLCVMEDADRMSEEKRGQSPPVRRPIKPIPAHGRGNQGRDLSGGQARRI